MGVYGHAEPRKVVSDFEAKREDIADEGGNALRGAEVGIRPVADKARERYGLLRVDILVGVLQPEHTGVRTQEELEDVEPLLLEVLAFVHHKRVEEPLIGNCGADDLLLHVLPETRAGPRRGEVEPPALRLQELRAEAVPGIDVSPGRNPRSKTFGQAPIEADHERTSSVLDRPVECSPGDQALSAPGRTPDS